MQKNQIVAIIAVVVIIAAIGFIVWRAKSTGGGEAVSKQQEVLSKQMFYCTNCKNKFPKPADVDLAMLMPGQPVKCPKCGKKAAYPMVKCIHCGTWFFNDLLKQYPPGMIANKLVCPKCGKLALK